MDNRWRTRKWLLYTVVGVLVDALVVILTFVVPEKKLESSHSSDVDELSDDAILALSKMAPRVHPDYGVRKLTPTTVVKSSQDMEEDAIDATKANALQLVFEKTTIPVPRVRRVVKGEWDFLIRKPPATREISFIKVRANG
ncbi:hypothetical protein EV401DRAFT_2078426 [Pisolithus croceorrhizus]|nr:hypothetical protein EV401DRAFT_2078426 [Pisolithus croceorrhizus]